MFIGKIVSWLPENADKDPALFKVQHEDGDLEDLELEEVLAGAVEAEEASEKDSEGDSDGEMPVGALCPLASSPGAGAAAAAAAAAGVVPMEGGCSGCGQDSDPENVLLCDKCEAEWHIYCLKPPLAKIPEGDWVCPACVRATSDDVDPVTRHMHSAWEAIRTKTEGRGTKGRLRSEGFLVLPPKEDFPTYYEQIESPISLGMIRQRLSAGEYRGVWGSFALDVQLMFANAAQFNLPDSQICKDAKALKKVFNGFAAKVPASDVTPETGSGSASSSQKKHSNKRALEVAEQPGPRKRPRAELEDANSINTVPLARLQAVMPANSVVLQRLIAAREERPFVSRADCIARVTKLGQTTATALEAAGIVFPSQEVLADDETPPASETTETPAAPPRFCVCQSFAQEAVSWISCQVCRSWFHPKCVGLRDEDAAVADGWTCDKCQQKHVNDVDGVVIRTGFDRTFRKKPQDSTDLLCLCRQPQGEDELYILCDTCKEWFHPHCLGMTRKEVDAMGDDDWNCARCRAHEARHDPQPEFEPDLIQASAVDGTYDTAVGQPVTDSDYYDTTAVHMLPSPGNAIDTALRDCEVCALCGSSGRDESEFVFCTQCGESFHKRCLHENFNLSDEDCAEWVCLSCMRCAICDSHENDKEMVACDICDRGYHIYCLSPPLKSIPEGNWVCASCALCSSCGSKSPGPGKHDVWHEDCSLCTPCWKLKKQDRHCLLCNKAFLESDHSELSPMIQCDHCNMWCHTRCDSIDTESYRALSVEGVQYFCPWCREYHSQGADAAGNPKQVIDKIDRFVKRGLFWYRYRAQQLFAHMPDPAEKEPQPAPVEAIRDRSQRARKVTTESDDEDYGGVARPTERQLKLVKELSRLKAEEARERKRIEREQIALEAQLEQERQERERRQAAERAQAQALARERQAQRRHAPMEHLAVGTVDAVGSGELDRISKQMRGIFSKHGSHTSLPEEAELRTCERPNRC